MTSTGTGTSKILKRRIQPRLRGNRPDRRSCRCRQNLQEPSSPFRSIPDEISTASFSYDPLSPQERLDADSIQHHVTAEALPKFLKGQALTFADACQFWKIQPPTEGTNSDSWLRATKALINETGALLQRVMNLFGDALYGETKARNIDMNQFPSHSTCHGLLNLHRIMLDKFAPELQGLPPTSS